jgi:glycosyltransferase involved in cell wall biosynthesis
LLNGLGLDARLEPVATSEVALAAAQLAHVEPGDVLIWDRDFTGFVLLARVRAQRAHFIGRCSKSSFAAAQEMFRVGRAGRSKVVKLTAASEAMASGVPCVTTDVGDSAWIVGDTGIVVPPRDPAALAEGMAQLIAMGAQGRRDLGARARARIKDNFELADIVRSYYDLYREMVPEAQAMRPMMVA